MNNWLGRKDLTPYIVRSLEQIADYVESERVDVMVVAGDLFSEKSRDEGIARALDELRRIFGPFVARGGIILAVAGNHDSELQFEGMRHLLSLGAAGSRGRFEIRADPGFVALEGAGGERVQFVLMPYPTPRVYGRHDEESVPYSSPEERNRGTQIRFVQKLEQIKRDWVQPQFPTVLVSHVHVRGASGHTLYQVTEKEEAVFDPGQVSLDWAYAAYGHIHKPGPVGGNNFARYSGSPIALDLAERHDHKSCVVFDVDANGVTGDLRLLPLHGPRLHKIQVDATQEAPESFLPRLREQVGEDFAFCELTFDPSVHNLRVLRQEIERTLPGLYRFGFIEVGHEISTGPISIVTQENTALEPEVNNALFSDPTLVVRGFLERRLQNHARQADILALANELMASV